MNYGVIEGTGHGTHVSGIIAAEDMILVSIISTFLMR